MRPTPRALAPWMFVMALAVAGSSTAQPGSDPLMGESELGVAARPAQAPATPPASPVAILGTPMATAAPAPWTDQVVDLSGGPYLNYRARLVVVKAGKRTSRSISSATTDRLVDALQKVLREGGKVVELEIKGHGAPEVQTLGGGTFMIATGRNVIAQLKNGKDIDIAPLLQATLSSDALINLNSCETARGDDAITERLSKAMPGRTVSGGARSYQLGIPFTAKAFGTKRYFQDGQQKSKWWFWID